MTFTLKNVCISQWTLILGYSIRGVCPLHPLIYPPLLSFITSSQPVIQGSLVVRQKGLMWSLLLFFFYFIYGLNSFHSYVLWKKKSCFYRNYQFKVLVPSLTVKKSFPVLYFASNININFKLIRNH